jgi:hypothetical protein
MFLGVKKHYSSIEILLTLDTFSGSVTAEIGPEQKVIV